MGSIPKLHDMARSRRDAAHPHLRDGLVSFLTWHYGGSTVYDLSGNNLNGTPASGVKAGPNGMDFSANGNIQVPNSTLMDAVTGSVYLRFRTAQSANFLQLASRATAASVSGFSLFLDSSTSKPRCQIKTAGNGSVIDKTANTACRDGAWHDVVMTFSQLNSGPFNLYVDGKLEVTGTNTSAWSFASQAARMGTAVDSFWTQFTGQIKAFGWWGRTLFVSEVAKLSTDCYAPVRRIELSTRAYSFASPFIPISNMEGGIYDGMEGGMAA